MSTTFNYRTVTGDTFESISRKVYGFETEAPRLVKANPGISEPIPPGIPVVIPTLSGAPTNLLVDTATSGANEVAVLIDGRRFRFWESVEITRSLDSFDTVSISAPFDAGNAEFRETFRPFTYKPLEVFVGGVPLFSGTLVAVDPDVSATEKTVAASGYSRPGVLMDCTPPASSHPLEFNGWNLRDIAEYIASPFGIPVVFSADPGPVFDRESLGTGKKAFPFLVGLAKQRGLIISNTPEGALLFLKQGEPTKPVAVLRQGESPVTAVLSRFNPQEYYSHITGIEAMYIGGLGGKQHPERNNRLPNVLRPLTFKPEDVVSADVAPAVKSKMGRMFGSAASYDVSVATWRDNQGGLWAPGATVTLEAPDAMVYNATELFIRRVTLSKIGSSETASLELVLPGSFGGDIPEVLPWEG